MRYEEYANAGSGVPVIGGKCTIHLYSDADPCQIVRISASGKTIWIRENRTEHDPAKEGGMGHQNWLIHENDFVSEEMRVTRRKNGQWRETGSNCLVVIGQWHKYYDWEF